MNTIDKIQKNLINLSDKKYKEFHSKLIPTVDPDTVLGVRVPMIRNYAKKLYEAGEYTEFIHTLPHKYFDEYQLHSLLICKMKDFDLCVSEVERLLPYIDNWAVCDSLRPSCFKDNTDRLIFKIYDWINSDKPYTVRFAIEMLMCHFLGEKFDESYLKIVSEIKSDNYYVNMMIAWYFATALAYHYDDTIVYLEGTILSEWVHNKTIQKAFESNRISVSDKKYLCSLKIKK